LYGKYKDSILNEENSKIVEEINTKYKTAEKDNEIITQKSKIFKRNVAVFSLLGLLLLGLVYYKNYQNRQKIKLQKEILHQQDLATKAVMNAEDNERKRMATHLHDGIGQLLSAVNMNVSVLDEMRDNDEGYSKILGKTKDILNEAIADVRSLSHQIMPNMLIKNSLSNALRELIEKSNSPKLNITLYMEGLNDAIDQNIQIVLYRTIQECINNTIKHAEASHINISIIQDREKLQPIYRIMEKGLIFSR
jgi:Signal transduction histidine kinase